MNHEKVVHSSLMRLLVSVLGSLILISCNFNRQFLKPTTLPLNLTSLKVNTPADTFIVRYKGQNFQPNFFSKNGDSVKTNYSIESVVFKSTSGNFLNGWLLSPKNFDQGFTIVHFHGNAGYLLPNAMILLDYVKKGYQVFTFDYSGFGFSTGKSTRLNVLKDGLSAIDYVESRDDITRVILYGQSLGGNLAVVVAEERQDMIDGLVIEGSFSSHKDIAANSTGFLGRVLVKEQYSARESIKKNHVPLLVIHSYEDKTIPIEQSKDIFKLANEPKAFLEITG